MMKKNVVFLLFIAIFFSSCGYKPSAKYAREMVGESVSTSVTISLVDPENTVIIKDALDTAILEVFHASLRPRNVANTHLNISMQEIKYQPIQYNNEGFVVAYRAYIKLDIQRVTDKKKELYVTEGTYDFAIDANTIVSDQQRFDAIENSSVKAIKSFVAKVAAQGARKDKRGE
jgi:hypothetical protein